MLLVIVNIPDVLPKLKGESAEYNVPFAKYAVKLYEQSVTADDTYPYNT